jgi:DNA helicase-2/ATP-dependent DNA helicase PcrA
MLTESFTRVLGPPGTGKTKFLLDTVGNCLKNNTLIDDIAFLSFTRKAAEEARDKAKARFPHVSGNFEYFKTLHALCKYLLRIENKEVWNVVSAKEFLDLKGLDYSTSPVHYDDEETGSVPPLEHPYLQMIHLARTRCVDLETVYNEQNPDFDFDVLKIIATDYRNFKKIHGKKDFDDFLEEFVKSDISLSLNTIMLDEYQDISNLQFKVFDKLVKQCRHVYIAGDDDQTIYEWAGASSKLLIDLTKYENLPVKTIILDQSYRVPRVVANLAKKIVKRINHRIPKIWKPKEIDPKQKDLGYVEGRIIYHRDPEHVPVNDRGSWFILARINRILKEQIPKLRQQGIWYRIKSSLAVTET